jgi:hypothetical protein
MSETGMDGIKASTGDRRERDQSNNIINVVNINSGTARRWQPSVNSQRREAPTPVLDFCGRFHDRSPP